MQVLTIQIAAKRMSEKKMSKLKNVIYLNVMRQNGPHGKNGPGALLAGES